MARTNNLTDFLTDIANAIRSKKGTSETIPAEDFDTEIENLPSGGGDLDEYFVTEINANTTGSANALTPAKLVKKYPDVQVADNVTRLSYALYNFGDDTAPKLTFNNNVTDLSNMLESYRPISVDVSGFNTSNVTNMSRMFYNSSLTNVDLSNFVTDKVTNMSAMFSGCASLSSVNLNNLNTPVLQDIRTMFLSCSSLTSIDLSSFHFGNVANSYTNMMFSGCTNLSHIDIRNFSFANIGVYANMFGADASNGVPDNCEIIVADDTAKTWINTNFSRLTNVKTVAEYEAE